MTWLAVAIGGAAGACARHNVGAWLSPDAGLHLSGTLAANLAGALLLGLLVGGLPATRVPIAWRVGLTTGLCGGFTTFSTFAYETVALIGLGQISRPLGYVLVTLTLGPLAMMAGLWLSGGLPPGREAHRS